MKPKLNRRQPSAECLRGPMAGAEQAGFGEVYGSFERISQKAEPQLQRKELHERVSFLMPVELGRTWT